MNRTLDARAARLLGEYRDDLTVRRLADATVALRMQAARDLARAGDLLDLTRDDLAKVELRTWSFLSPATHSSYRQCARDLFGWLDRAGYRDRDDDPSQVLHRVRVPRSVPRPMAEDDLELALAAGDALLRVWIALAAFAGLRCCEIAGLTREQVVDRGADPHLVITGKGGNQRVVPVGPGLLTELRRYGLPSSGPVFRRLDGTVPTRLVVSARINRHLHRMGIPSTAHQLRHRYATVAYRCGRDLRLVQELLGHSSPTTTSRYALADTRHARDVLRDVEQLWTARQEDSADE